MQGSPEGGSPIKGQFSIMVSDELGCLKFNLRMKELMGEAERENTDKSLSSKCLFPTRSTEQLRSSVDRKKEAHIHICEHMAIQ